VTAEGDAAAVLARDFDRRFAQPARAAPVDLDTLIAIRAGGERYAVRVRDMTGLLADRAVVPLPSPLADLLGLVSLRGGLLPVYCLASLLGHRRPAAAPRWILLAGPGPLVGLACDQFDRHLTVARSDVAPASAAHGHVRGSLAVADGTLPLISVESILDAITRRAGVAAKTKER
jgi:purine-binding chemotaxis protein CheW